MLEDGSSIGTSAKDQLKTAWFVARRGEKYGSGGSSIRSRTSYELRMRSSVESC